VTEQDLTRAVYLYCKGDYSLEEVEAAFDSINVSELDRYNRGLSRSVDHYSYTWFRSTLKR